MRKLIYPGEYLVNENETHSSLDEFKQKNPFEVPITLYGGPNFNVPVYVSLSQIYTFESAPEIDPAYTILRSLK